MQNYWYIATDARDLIDKPLACRILGQNIVLFRTAGTVAALADNCPHRNVRLSEGKINRQQLQCPYHGWEFNHKGECTKIPSLCEHDKIPRTATVKNYPVQEKYGYIWVWLGDKEPGDELIAIKHFQEKGWLYKHLEADINNSVANVIENFVDNPHTGYIHGGLFRASEQHTANVNVKRLSDGVLVETEEESFNNSILAKLMLKKGEKLIHYDHFILPSIIKVSYFFGSKYEMTGYHVCTPIDAYRTKLYIHVTWKFGPLNYLVKSLVPLFSKIILKQDVDILENQTRIIKQYGENFVSVPADTANLWIRQCREKGQDWESLAEKEKNISFRI